MKAYAKLFLASLMGVALGAGAVLWLSGPDGERSATSGKPAPLYWVAPMDPDYRRDSPGKSPMGMDLVPVYPDGHARTGAGVVEISPAVVNNLGVRTALAGMRSMQAEIRTVGYVRYDEDRLIHMHPRVEGWVEKLHVKAAGDPVERGQPVYDLYSPQLVNAQEELVLAMQRDNRLLLQAAEDRLKALQLSPAFIADLKSTRQVRQNVTFRAPQRGVVDNLNIREGFYVQPGTTLMSIGSLDDVWVEAEVFERQAAMVRVGLPVTMTLDYLPGRAWEGRVDYTYPSLDERTRTLRVRLRFPNGDGALRPNMFAQVVIHAAQDQPVLAVPREALIRTGTQDRVVLALEAGRFKSVAVSVGRLDSAHAEILAGLAEGDRVVSSAQFLLDSESSRTSDFQRLQARGEPQSAAVQRATVAGRVDAIDAAAGTVTISRDAIPKWGRPPATLDFQLGEGVDRAVLIPGERVRFTFTVQSGRFTLTAAEAQGAVSAAKSGGSAQ